MKYSHRLFLVSSLSLSVAPTTTTTPPTLPTLPAFDASSMPWVETVALEANQDIFDKTGSARRFGSKIVMSSDGTTMAVYSTAGTTNASEISLFYQSTNSSSWTQRGSKIVGPVNDGGTEPLALSSNGTMLFMAGTFYNDDRAGAATDQVSNSTMIRVLQFNDTNWELHSTVPLDDVNNSSDVSISISDDASVLAIGVASIGVAAVVAWNTDENDWVQRGESFRGIVSDVIDGVGVDVSLSADGSILAIASSGSAEVVPVKLGAHHKVNPSYVATLEWTGSEWTDLGEIWYGQSIIVNDDYTVKAASLSSDGTVLAVEIPGRTLSDPNRGRVRIYARKEGTKGWGRRGFPVFGSDEQSDGLEISSSLSSDGNYLAIGSPMIGSVQIFEWVSTRRNWIQLGNDLEDRSAQFGLFGESVALAVQSDGIVLLAVGAPMHDNMSQMVDTGTVRFYTRSSVLVHVP